MRWPWDNCTILGQATHQIGNGFYKVSAQVDAHYCFGGQFDGCAVKVPAAVRKRLNLKPGDTVLFEESEAGTVCIRRAEPLEIEFLSALEGTLSEGNSDNDERAYRDL